MLTPEEDVEITSLRKRGWSISAIARHVGHNRKTARGYLSGGRQPGVRERAEPDPFEVFEPYVRQRLADDQHVWATTLFDEVAALGYTRSYQTFTRQLRDRQLRPYCEPCLASNGRAHVDIEHPAGEEIQWDWLELDDTPWDAKVETSMRETWTSAPSTRGRRPARSPRSAPCKGEPFRRGSPLLPLQSWSAPCRFRSSPLFPLPTAGVQ